MDATPDPARQGDKPVAARGQQGTEPVIDDDWSPWSTSGARWSWGLLAIFVVIYFVVAILTSKEFADLAATMILGLPLGFILGIGLIIVGLVITRIYLAKVEA